MGMTWDDYLDETLSNAKESLRENLPYVETFDEAYDSLFIDDSVTGNGSGSYTFSTQKAIDNISDLIWDEEITELFDMHGYDSIPMEKGPEAIDVILRCFALCEVSGDLEDYFNILKRESEARQPAIPKAV